MSTQNQDNVPNLHTEEQQDYQHDNQETQQPSTTLGAQQSRAQIPLTQQVPQQVPVHPTISQHSPPHNVREKRKSLFLDKDESDSGSEEDNNSTERSFILNFMKDNQLQQY